MQAPGYSFAGCSTLDAMSDLSQAIEEVVEEAVEEAAEEAVEEAAEEVAEVIEESPAGETSSVAAEVNESLNMAEAFRRIAREEALAVALELEALKPPPEPVVITVPMPEPETEPETVLEEVEDEPPVDEEPKREHPYFRPLGRNKE